MQGRFLFESDRLVLIDGSTGSGKSRYLLIPTLDLLTYGDGSAGSEPHTVVVSDVKNELLELCGDSLVMRGPLRECCGSDPGKPMAPALLKAKSLKLRFRLEWDNGEGADKPGISFVARGDAVLGVEKHYGGRWEKRRLQSGERPEDAGDEIARKPAAVRDAKGPGRVRAAVAADAACATAPAPTLG